ncbi:MAG: UPF0175 family protein [Candidatus Latescibacterota bacterium]|nr:MAG: UPF0175 family protein [Candidatus Latescibacterota bacterium]
MPGEVEARLRFPQEITTVCKVDEEELGPYLKELIAIELYREGVVSLGKAAEIAGVDKVEMMDLLRRKKIPLHYGLKELREDMETIG